jgi:hypothetical protein
VVEGGEPGRESWSRIESQPVTVGWWLGGAAFLVASILWALFLRMLGDSVRPYIGATNCSGDSVTTVFRLPYFATFVVTAGVVALGAHIIRRESIAFGSLFALAGLALVGGLIAGWPVMRVASTNCGV